MRYTVVIHFWDGSKLSQQYAFNQLCPIMGKDLDDSVFNAYIVDNVTGKIHKIP